MALQSALSRLGGSSEPPEGDNSRQRKLDEENKEQAVEQRTVFSIGAEEKDFFDLDSVSTFIIQPDRPPHAVRPGQSPRNTHTVGVSLSLQHLTQYQGESSSENPLKKSRSTREEANPRNGGVSMTSTFRKSIFNPQKDANSFALTGAPFASFARDSNTDALFHQHATAQTIPYQQSNTESFLPSSSQTLTETHTPFSPRQFLPLKSGTATPTSFSSTPSFSHKCPSSTQSSSHTPSPHPLPFPPLTFSTPQRASNTTTVIRRFPGPAGVLPKLVPVQYLDGVVTPNPHLPTPTSTPRAKTLATIPSRFPSCSQSNTTDGRSASGNEDPVDFTQGPWKSMMQDLDMNDVYSARLLKCSIARAIKQASRQQLRNGKVTHLRVMLKSIVSAGRNASAVLKDPTGEVLCTIHRSVLEEYQQELQPGAVFILRQVTVFSPAPRKHYLCITPENIVVIYPASDMVTREPIRLTEMEKRFGDPTATKENKNASTDYLINPKNSRINSKAHNMMDVGLSSVQRDLHEHNPSASQTSLPSTPTSPKPWDHTHQIMSHGLSIECHSQQPMDSIFSDRFLDDEFDSLVGSMDNGLEF